MKSLLSALMLLSLSVQAAEIAPFTAHYQIRFSGLSGESVTTLSQQDDGVFVLENRVSAKGLARLVRSGEAIDRSEFIKYDNGLRPVAFISVDGSKRNKRGSTIIFDWDGGVANTEYKEESKSVQLKPGMLDRQLLQIAMMSDLTDGLTETSYSIIDRHSVKNYTMSVMDSETIEVPAGSFDVVRVERNNPGSSRSTVFWCAPSLDYLTIKMEQHKDGKVIGTLELTEVS